MIASIPSEVSCEVRYLVMDLDPVLPIPNELLGFFVLGKIKITIDLDERRVLSWPAIGFSERVALKTFGCHEFTLLDSKRSIVAKSSTVPWDMLPYDGCDDMLWISISQDGRMHSIRNRIGFCTFHDAQRS